MALKPDTSAAIDFLHAWEPKGPWVLSAILPDRKVITTRTFRAGQEEAAQEFIGAQNGRGGRNIYFHVNPVLRDLTSKANREDIKEVAWLHVDVDPRVGEDLREEQERIRHLLTDNLPAGVPPPTSVVFSGGGYQGFWKLEEPIPINGDLAKAEDAKRYNQQLELLFGADNCHNIDRIMRLPGTINIPDAKKKKKGRKRVRADVVDWHKAGIYPITNFTPVPQVQMAGETGFGGEKVEVSGNIERYSVEDLNQWHVPDRLKVIIVQGSHPEERKEGDNSRSAWLFDVCCNLIRLSVPVDVIFSVVTDPDFGISESVLEQKDPAKYAKRQIQSAKDKAGDFDKADGKLQKSQANIRKAVHRLGHELSYDEFADRLLIDGEFLDDATMTDLYLRVDEEFDLRVTKEFFWMVVTSMARRNAFHPVRDYLDSLNWDGTKRIDTWLPAYLGTEANEYTKAVGRLSLVAAARRIRKPGCKYDEIVVLEGEQGEGKSRALQELAGGPDWFSDDLPLNADTKRQIESLQGRWIVEASELKGMRKGDVEHMKAFASRQVDRARMSYDRLVTEVPRQCVIFGTTNSSAYLRDNTGNRRFLPVRVGKIDLEALRADRDQLWAEAAKLEAEGESIRLDPHLYPLAAREQEERRIEDPFLHRLSAVLGDLSGKLRATDAWRILGVPPGQQSQEHNARMGEALRELGWERVKRRFNGHPEWGYVRGDQHERGQIINVDPTGERAWVGPCPEEVLGPRSPLHAGGNGRGARGGTGYAF